VLEFRHERQVRPVVLVGLDVSASMARRDVQVGAEIISRIQAVQEAMADSRRLEAIANHADVQVFTLADGLRSAGGLELAAVAPADATGLATAIGDAAAAALEPHVAAGRDVAAVVLVSDGCSNTAVTITPDKLAALLASRGVPIFAAGVGSEVPLAATQSLSMKELAAPDEVEVFHRLPISATVEAIGLGGRRVRVTCRLGEEQIGETTMEIASRQESRNIHFAHAPSEGGFHRLSLTAEVLGEPVNRLAGEATAGKLVHVTDRQIRVLYVEGSFRYEGKYIAAALAGGRRFSLERRVLLAPAGGRGNPLSDRLDDWLRYDVILLGDTPADRFTPAQIGIMRELVGEHGRGLCMIGGRGSFADGGWDTTLLADVLGAELGGSSGQIDRDVKVTPTPGGLEESFMKLGEGESADHAAAWDALRPLGGASALGAPKPAARVLATDGQGHPLIVAQRYGRGRSLAVAFDATWRWVLSPDETGDLQRRFWRQAILHLAARRGNVWIATDRAEYDLASLANRAETIEITAGIEDAAGRPMPDAEVRVTLTPPEGMPADVVLAADGELLRGQLPPPGRAGTYGLEIAADADGRQMRAEQLFDVVHRDLEALEPLANLSLLRRLSEITHGRYADVSELAALLAEVRSESASRIDVELTHANLADVARWPLAAGLVALLCAEWIGRKRRGLA